MVQLFRSGSSNSVVKKAATTGPSIASAIGRGLGGLGNTAAGVVAQNSRTEQQIDASNDRIAAIEKGRERTRRSVQFAGQLSQTRLAYQEWQADARANTEAGAPNWTDTALEKQEEMFGPLLDSVADDEELALRLAPTIQSVTAQLASSELAWQQQQDVKWQGESFKQMLDVERDSLQGTEAKDMAEALKQSLARAGAILEEMDLPGTDKAILSNVMGTTLLTQGALDGLIEQQQYSSVRELIESGEFDGMLGDRRDNYIRTVEAGERAQAVSAQRQESAQRDEWRVQRNLVLGRVERGESISPGDVSALQTMGEKLGIPADELQDLQFSLQDGVYGASARQLDEAKLTGTIADLQERRAAGELSAEQERYLSALEKEQGQRDTKTGTSIRELSKSGIEGQIMAAAQLAELPIDRRWAAAREAGDDRLAVYAGLTEKGRVYAVQGREVRKARPEDFLPPKTGTRSGKQKVRDGVKEYLGPVLTRQLGGAFDEVVETALDVMAGSGGEWSESNFKVALRVVYGARRRANGTIEGGFGKIRSGMVELPQTLTAPEFDAQLSRHPFLTAYYAGNVPAKKADILENFTPVPTGGARQGWQRYQFVDSSGRALLNKQGEPFIADFGR